MLYRLVNACITNWKITMLFMGKLTNFQWPWFPFRNLLVITKGYPWCDILSTNMWNIRGISVENYHWPPMTYLVFMGTTMILLDFLATKFIQTHDVHDVAILFLLMMYPLACVLWMNSPLCVFWMMWVCPCWKLFIMFLHLEFAPFHSGWREIWRPHTERKPWWLNVFCIDPHMNKSGFNPSARYDHQFAAIIIILCWKPLNIQ